MPELYSQRMAVCLRELRNYQNIDDLCAGICHNVTTQHQKRDAYGEDSFQDVADWLEDAFTALGVEDTAYPVPHPDYIDEERAYDKAGNKWQGKYGANRLYLLELLITLAEGWKPSENFQLQWPHP